MTVAPTLARPSADPCAAHARRVLVVIPAFNEERTISDVVAAVRRVLPDADVCVVDDGSTDRTGHIARRSGAMVLPAAVNLGIGGAVQVGYLWAREHAYDVAIQIDGDGQHDPRHIPAALEQLSAGADVVIGSRFLGDGAFRSTTLRRAGIRYLAWFLRVRCGAHVTDPTSGFRCVGARAIRLFASEYPSDYPEPEAIALAVRSGLTVREIPVAMNAREHGQSSIGALRTLYYLVRVSLGLVLLPPARRLPTHAEEVEE